MFEVYIHVPFCLRRCGYCDFNTYTATDLGAGASRGNYANMVIREMKLTKHRGAAGFYRILRGWYTHDSCRS